MHKVYLCNEKNDSIQITVTAEIIDGCLRISGQDLGEACRMISGEDEYEYFYTFDKKNTQELFSKLWGIHGEPDFDKLLLNSFSGTEGCKKLREFCEMNSISYSFYSC